LHAWSAEAPSAASHASAAAAFRTARRITAVRPRFARRFVDILAGFTTFDGWGFVGSQLSIRRLSLDAKPPTKRGNTRRDDSDMP
jgi:hypothetical protein